MTLAISSSRSVVRTRCCQNVGVTLASGAPVRIQLCGATVVEGPDGRIDERLPGRQGRVLFAYLVLNRHRPVGRDELAEALWSGELPRATEGGLNALLSKLRRTLGAGVLDGRSSLRLRLPDGARVDVEI